jgi:hypothetical protein
MLAEKKGEIHYNWMDKKSVGKSTGAGKEGLR